MSVFPWPAKLRDWQARVVVGAVSRKTGVDHRELSAELIKRTEGRVDQATVAQLLRRMVLVEMAGCRV